MPSSAPSSVPARLAGPGLLLAWLAACAPVAEAPVEMPVEMPAGTPEEALPPELVEVRKRMVQGAPVAFADMRGIADRDDGYAAWLLAERLRAAERWDLASEMAHYYAVAAASGRSGGVGGLIGVLEHPGFDPATVSPERMAWLEQTLLRAARQENPKAQGYLVDAYTAGAPFGDRTEDAIALLGAGRTGTSAPLALDMATGMLRSGPLDAPSLRQVRQLLEIAAADDSLEARITTANLLAVLDDRLLSDPQPGDLPHALE
ncbi:hypothetical protein [Tropicimonas aquimaris]|uniref:Sel1 repeat family protein n=1 Tax=Tropicimonas aquimaris TaxID=914152 RepID=A0ABW3IKW0_9RHOB